MWLVSCSLQLHHSHAQSATRPAQKRVCAKRPMRLSYEASHVPHFHAPFSSGVESRSSGISEREKPRFFGVSDGGNGHGLSERGPPVGVVDDVPFVAVVVTG